MLFMLGSNTHRHLYRPTTIQCRIEDNFLTNATQMHAQCGRCIIIIIGDNGEDEEHFHLTVPLTSPNEFM